MTGFYNREGECMLPTKRTNGRIVGNEGALDRKYWDWHVAVSLFGTVFRGRSCNSKSFTMIFGLRIFGYCPCVFIIVNIIRVSQTHIQGLWHIIQFFLHIRASRYMAGPCGLNPSRGKILLLLQTPSKQAVEPTQPPIHRTLWSLGAEPTTQSIFCQI